MIKAHGEHRRHKDLNPDAHHFYCLVLLQVPNCYVPIQIFRASPKIRLHLVPFKDFCASTKTNFTECKSSLSGTKCLWLPQYVKKFLVWHKKSGPAQNILGPAKGQSICFFSYDSTVPAISSFVFEVPDSQFKTYFVMFRIVCFQYIFPSFYNFYFLRSRNLCLHPCWSFLTGSFKIFLTM